MDSVAGKLCHCLEVQKVVYRRMLAEYVRRVELAIACDWRKVRRHSRGSVLKEEWGLVLSLLLEPADKTAPCLIILSRSFCGKDGKPGSVTFVGGWFLGIIGVKASGRGAVNISTAFPVGGLGPGATGERKPSWFPSPASSYGNCGRSACELAGERRGMGTFELASTGA